MGYVPPEGAEALVEHDLRPVIYDLAVLDAVEAAAGRSGKNFPVHLKFETGTNRQGILEADLPGYAERFRAATAVVLEGISTHFANIEDTTDHRFAEEQLVRFEAAVERLRAAGFRVPIRHTACSAAALVFPETRFEMVRLGIAQYGLWPSKETLLSYRSRSDGTVDADDPRGALHPVLTWKTRVTQVKDVPAGAYVGYGCTYQTTRPTRIAVLPIGYADGYDRRLSGQAHVLVGGRRAPVRGRVCMNLTMVDVTDVPAVALEDEVVLLGRQGEQEIRAEQLAGWIGTIHYEVVARISASIPRLPVAQGVGDQAEVAEEATAVPAAAPAPVPVASR
jgi:alanine racemase